VIRLRVAAVKLRNFLAEQRELQQRLALLNRPWEEHYLHWAGTGSECRLHGSIVPPADGRRRSVTAGGWCPGLRREAMRQVSALNADGGD
jgi:hypothetical protein